MTIIFVLSFLLLLVVWVFTLIGLFSPKRVQSLWKGKELTRKDVAIGGVVSSVVLFVVIGLTAPDAEEMNNSTAAQTAAADTAKAQIIYNIVSDDKKRDVYRKVQVELKERLSKQQLEQLAHEIKDADSSRYDKVFILYRIEGEKSVTAWASSNFEPDLNIKIYGLELSDFQKLLKMKTDVNGDVIGKWVSPNGFSDHIIIFYKNNGKVFKQDIYIDATLSPDELVQHGSKYRYKDPKSTTTFVIDANGTLEEWNDSGKFYTALKLEKYNVL
jgi:flagellar basal body-associated protein FliL